MPLPLLAIGIGAATGALMEAINEFQSSGDPQALQAARQARGQAIMDAMAQGMSRMEAEQNVDASVLDAIKRNEQGVNAGNIIGGAVVGGALGGLGAAAAGTKWGAQALSKMGLGRGAVGAKYAKPAGPQKPITIDEALARAEAGPAVTRRTIAPSPVAARGLVPVGPVTPAQNMGTGFVGAGRMRPSGMASAGPSYGNVPRTYDVVPEGTPQLGYQGGANPMQLGYNPSRLPPSALSAEEATLVRNLGMPNVPGPTSPFTPPGAGMPPMMVQNMMAQGEADAIRAAAAARQAAWKRRLGTITGD